MIPPGLWAAFSMMDCILSRLSDARHTGMCLIFALSTANKWKRAHTTANKNSDESIQNGMTINDCLPNGSFF